MSTANETTATIENAEIVGIMKSLGQLREIIIRRDDGSVWYLDRRCVNIKFPKVGQRGWLEYRDYEFGSRWFFDAAAVADRSNQTTKEKYLRKGE